jgi:hypothetical protein
MARDPLLYLAPRFEVCEMGLAVAPAAALRLLPNGFEVRKTRAL